MLERCCKSVWIDGLTLGCCSLRRLVECSFELFSKRLWKTAWKCLDANGEILGQWLGDGCGIVDTFSRARDSDDGPAIVFDNFQRDAIGERDRASVSGSLDRPCHALQRGEQCVEIFYRHISVHGHIRAIGCNDHSQRTLHIQAGQAFSLRGHQERSLHQPGQARRVNLRTEPGELFFEVAVAVACGDSQHLLFGGTGLNRSQHRQENGQATGHGGKGTHGKTGKKESGQSIQ